MAGRRARRVPKRLTLGSEAAGKWSEANMETELDDELYDEQLGLTLSASILTAGRELAGTIGTAFSAVTGASSAAATTEAALGSAAALQGPGKRQASEVANAKRTPQTRKRRRTAQPAPAVAAAAEETPTLAQRLWKPLMNTIRGNPADSAASVAEDAGADATTGTGAAGASAGAGASAAGAAGAAAATAAAAGDGAADAAAGTAAAAPEVDADAEPDADTEVSASAAAPRAAAAAPASTLAPAVDIAPTAGVDAGADAGACAVTSQSFVQLPPWNHKKHKDRDYSQPPWNQDPPDCNVEVKAMIEDCRRTAARAPEGFRREILKRFADQVEEIMAMIPGEENVEAAQKNIAIIAQHKETFYHHSEQFARDWAEDATGGSVPTPTSIGFFMPALGSAGLCARINAYELAKFKSCPPALLEQAAQKARTISNMVSAATKCVDCQNKKATFGKRATGRRAQWCANCKKNHSGAIDVRNTPCVCCDALTQPHYLNVNDKGIVSRKKWCGECSQFRRDAYSDNTSCAVCGIKGFDELSFMIPTSEDAVSRNAHTFLCKQCVDSASRQTICQGIRSDQGLIELKRPDRQPKRKTTGRRKSRADPALPTTGAAPALSTTGVEVALSSTRAAPAPALQQPTDEDEVDDFVVKSILAKRTRQGKLEYRVRWLGYGEDDDTWEPKRNLTNVHEKIAEFEAKEMADEIVKVLGFQLISAMQLARKASAKWTKITVSLGAKCDKLSPKEKHVLERYCDAAAAYAADAPTTPPPAKRSKGKGKRAAATVRSAFHEVALRQCADDDIKKLQQRCKKHGVSFLNQ